MKYILYYIQTTEFFTILEDLGIGYKYLVNGFVGALVWSLYRKTKLVEAIRQILIGSIVAGYFTPLIAHTESLPDSVHSALSFIIGMTGMVILDGVYKFIVKKVRALKTGEKVINEEENNQDQKELEV